MPLISVVGRRSVAVRLLVTAIYVILIGGATTAVYPFLVMVSGSFKTNVDKNDFDILPAFFHDDLILYRKHLECKYNNSLILYNMTNRQKEYEFRTTDPPAMRPEGPSASPEELAQATNVRVADLTEFIETVNMPDSFYQLGYMSHVGDNMRLWKAREFRQELIDESHGDIQEYNRRYDDHVESWIGVGAITERITERRYKLSGDPGEKRTYEFKKGQPIWFRIYESLDGKYVQGYLEAIYGREIEEYNELHGTRWSSYRELVMPPTAPAEPLQRKDWERFVREELNLQYIRVTDEARPVFAEFLKERHAGDLATLNQRYGTSFASFDDVTYPEDYIHASDRQVDWEQFVKAVPVEHLYLITPEFEYRDFLRRKYKGDLAALNQAQGTTYSSFDLIPIPVRDFDYATFLANESDIRTEFLTANYKQVADYIFLHGRSLMNTIIYCGLSIVLSLTVCPLAAYALSRFKLPSTYKILLFCMATMAFPTAVTMIPNFLLLKQLHLLNTYAALVLPGMANGFSIFLLKGFFDSLPRELYESAQLDGASEWRMFWQFTMALSKPILAVLALGAFTAAYGNFMFAFILCPDEKMWTLMVFLYQLQNGGHMGLTFAALLLAAIPTFVVFVFCQNIIIRGIVVPVEK